MTANSGLGLTINYPTAALFPYFENVAVKTWDNHVSTLQQKANGTGNGYNALIFGVDESIGKLNQAGNDNKIAIMLTTNYPCGKLDSNDNPNPGCTSGSQCNLVCDANDTSICSRDVNGKTLFSSNIQMLVIYSHPSNDYDFGCILQNSSRDFFYLNDSMSNSYASLNTITSNVLDIMCPLEEYTIQITEVKVSTSSLNVYQSYDAPFIEILNTHSSPINLKKITFEGLVIGSISNPPKPRLSNGEYLVLYNADIGNVTCQDCPCTKSDGNRCDNAIYIPCGTGYDCQFDSSMV